MSVERRCVRKLPQQVVFELAAPGDTGKQAAAHRLLLAFEHPQVEADQQQRGPEAVQQRGPAAALLDGPRIASTGGCEAS